ncbi:YfjI family protein [Psychrobacillus psychrotolerans]|uniref:YfjI family protein n=1 Tax=Psychrobacillus psychrotolerans TaxID=126156 RepID=UPI003314F5CB
MNTEKIISIVSPLEEQWERPIDIENTNLPVFNTDVFPKWLRDYIEAVAEETQTPKDVAAMASIALLSTIISGSFEVKLTNSWTETLNTYTVMALDPANRKSAVFNLFIKPIDEYIKNQSKILLPTIAEENAKRTASRKRLNVLQEQFSKTKSGKEDISLLNEIEKLAKETDDQLNPLVKIPRFYTNDVTPEQLAQLLFENGERLSILSAEGAELFEMIAGRYSNKSNLDLYLKAYSGDNVTIDRVNGRSISLNKPKLTLGLFVQPIVLQQLPSNFTNRGLTQRFLFFLPKSFIGYRKVETEEIPLEVEDSFKKNINSLLDIKNAGLILTFDEEARQYLTCILEEIERMLSNQDLNPEFKGWLGKLCGQIIRIAGLIHVSENISNLLNEIPKTINIQTLYKADSLRNYFISHAEQTFGRIGEDKYLDDVMYVLRKLLNGNNNPEKIDYQELWQVVKRRIKKAEKLKEILYYLEELNYIKNDKVGRKSIILINPQLNNYRI